LRVDLARRPALEPRRVIELRDVTFAYEDMAMRFGLAVAEGEFLGIIGPSGAGKSTLLSLIAGFDLPLSGTILIGGRDMAGAAPAARPVSMVFQDHNAFAHLTVRTNVALGLSPRLALTAEQWRTVDAALERTGLAGFSRRLPGELSGGERQRIAIARTLVRERPVLLLDEPFAALGPALRREMLELIVAVQRERGLTVLMVTHQPDDAWAAASHIAFVSEGRVLAKRPAKEMFAAKDLPELGVYLGNG
jgi:thiamine transport system ATP-binding protein